MKVGSPASEQVSDVAAHKKRRMETSMLALDKVPVSHPLCFHTTTDTQPSSEEARELHELMLEVIDKNVTEISGQKLVPMKDTKARTLAAPTLPS